MMSVKNISSEVRSENPFVVSLDAVVGDDGVAAAAAGDSNELTGRVCRCVFAAWRFFCSSYVKHVGDLCQRPCGLCKLTISRIHWSPGISYDCTLEINECGVCFFY